MPRHPSPSPYNTSEPVRTGISAAFSTFNNPRGLEVLWNGPYGQTFRELLSSYPDGQFVLYSPYRLWQPKLVKEEHVLRKEFEEFGLDYDDPPESPDEAVRAVVREVSNLEAAFDQLAATASNDPKRSSLRIAQEAKSKQKKKLEAKKETIKRILKQRKELNDMQVAMAERMHKSEQQGDTSIDTLDSFHDIGSFNLEPDMFIGHIATTRLRLPDEEGKYRYALRAGRKTYHQCGAAIVELKPGPKRTASDEGFPTLAHSRIKEAQDNLLDYCSAYFGGYPDEPAIVAIAVAGPLWKWAQIKRRHAPEWNYIEDEPDTKDPQNAKLAKAWNGRFSKDFFQLGTPTSDAELTLINEKYFHSLLTNHHTPEVPEHLQVDEAPQSLDGVRRD